MQKMAILASFWKTEACGQTVLPDRSVLVENSENVILNAPYLTKFQTLEKSLEL